MGVLLAGLRREALGQSRSDGEGPPFHLPEVGEPG